MAIPLYFVEIFLGVGTSFWGFVIWRYNVVDIISGYDASKTIDKQSLAKWLGSNLIIIGILSILFAVISIISNFYLNVSISIFPLMLVYSILIIKIIMRCKKFES